MSKVTIVLGAGIIGVSTAIHLARRGRTVVLVDRRDPGEETSFGNAGLIQREGVVPYAFPQDLGLLLRYGLNNRIDAHYHVSALAKLVPFLARYWWHSNKPRHEVIARAYAPLIENSISEHQVLIEAANAGQFIRKDGWMELFRTTAKRDGEVAEAERLGREYGISFKSLTREELAREEPHLSDDFVGALKWNDPWSVTNPHGLTAAYLAYFQSLGGRFVKGDASTLEPGANGRGWRVKTDDGMIEGEEVVLAVGPWAQEMTRLPLPARGQARLSHALCAGRQCGFEQLGDGWRARLFPRADGKGHPPDDRCGICRSRCAEIAGPAGAGRKGGAGNLSARRTAGCRTVDGRPPLHTGHDAGDRQGAAP